MERLHYLNVKEGDCSVIQHASGRVTVVDVCNATLVSPLLEAATEGRATVQRRVSGNFGQKKHPVNPISYLSAHGIRSVFRYVQTHPDMDHMDGIEALFATMYPSNFWDTNNKEEKEFSATGPYKESDWRFYKRLRDGNPRTNPKRLTLEPLSSGEYYNEPDGGDGLYVLAPSRDLVAQANETGSYNEASYVLLFVTSYGHSIVLAGDSHDKTWEYVLERYEDLVTDVDLLVAPHHGRKSGRSYAFLDVLRPTLTFFGNARHEHLAYGAWNSRGFNKITNNQAGCMVVDLEATTMELYVTNASYARTVNRAATYNQQMRAYHVGSITKGLRL